MKKKPSIKVLLVVASNNIGGVEKRFFNLMTHIQKINSGNFEYTFLFHRRVLKKLGVRSLGFNSTQYLKLKTYGFTKKISFPKLEKRISQALLFSKLLKLRFLYPFHSVHFVTTVSANFSFIFLQKNKVSTFYNGGSTIKGVTTKLFKNIMKDKNFIIDCLSENIKEEILKKFPKAEKRVHVSPCSFIDYSDTDFNYNEKENLIVFSGRFNDQKGINMLINFIPLFVNNVSNYKLLIMGYGPLEKEIEQAIAKCDGGEFVSLGFFQDPKVQLKISKIFLSLQKNENYPSQSLIEAMACGNIPIATDNGLTHLLVNENTGIRIPEDDSLALLNAVKLLINKKGEQITLSIRNREFVLNHHSPKRYLDYLNRLYEN